MEIQMIIYFQISQQDSRSTSKVVADDAMNRKVAIIGLMSRKKMRMLVKGKNVICIVV